MAAHGSKNYLRTLPWTHLGSTNYQKAWNIQESYRQRILEGKSNGILLITDHPPTITLGRAEKGSNLLAGREELQRQGYHVVETNRGGKVTFHGPGQLVVYPVVNLRYLKKGVKEYVCALEKTMIYALGRIGITAHRNDGMIGAWVGSRKIGSIGIHVRKNVSIHGIALNISTQLRHFAWITPCGIADVQMTSIEKEGITIGMDPFLSILLDSFSIQFECNIFEVGPDRNWDYLAPSSTIHKAPAANVQVS